MSFRGNPNLEERTKCYGHLKKSLSPALIGSNLDGLTRRCGEPTTGQMGFFDIANRYAGLDAKNGPLARIDEVVPWADFRPRLETVWRKGARGAEVAGGAETLESWGDVQGDRSLRSLQPFGRSGGVTASGSSFVHTVPGSGSRGQNPRRQDGVALSGTTGADGRDRGVVRGLRRLSGAAGLSGDGRPDHRRLDRAGCRPPKRASCLRRPIWLRVLKYVPLRRLGIFRSRGRQRVARA